MAGTQDSTTTDGAIWREFLSASIYKRHQGRIARQATFAALVATLALGVWRLSQTLAAWFGGAASLSGSLSTALGSQSTATDFGLVRFLLPLVLMAAGTWLVYRLVNVPRFADFLIAVETEMTKVSWPTAGEVARSSAVIIFLIFALSAILFLYDLFWRVLLQALQGFA
ncbi:MAG: preprotein translocase subunit SecE [Planctomycetia bacterium]|nr:preprotein translocase subunit SecE [Planctomycetia bacterium]